MLTRMLSLGNIMVVSSAVRRGPYWHLLETCLHSPHYSRHIESILRGVSERMGLTRFSVLFTSYASQLAYSIRKVESDIFRFPPHLLGYRDRKECAELTFRAFTPTNIWNGGERLFEGHCKVLQKSVDSGLQECFGDILGYQIVAWVDEHELPSSEMEEFLKSKTFQGQEFEASLDRNVDGIIASILRTLGDQDFSDNGPIIAALYTSDRTGQSAQIFQALVKHRQIEDFDSHQPNLPVFPAETILRALSWLPSRLPNTSTKATTYHVLHQLFADVEESPMVNEQLRLVNAISLWVASRNEEFNDPTLLHTIIHGATSLLAQSDLARSSQSILEWAFDRYRAEKTKDSRFPDNIIRIACLAHDYACNTLDPTMARMGNDLSQWIDNEAHKISKVIELKSQALRALPAWPHEPSAHLTKLYESVTAESLSAVLKDNRMSPNKFRLVRRLDDHAISNDYNEGNFTKSDFWRLKECIPSTEHLQAADIDAFAALLFRNKGAIDSFGSDRPESASLLSKHRRSTGGQITSSAQQIDKAQEFIVLTLLEMLQSNNASEVNTAYRTLRLIKSASTEALDQTVWPSEHQTELEYLKACRRYQKTRPSRDIIELSTSESFWESTKDFSQWIANITILLSDILSGQHPIYAQLTDILQCNIGFAEAILPVLVHTVLLAEKANTRTLAAPYRIALSSYFSSILSSESTSISCLRSIVEVILHLRHSSVSPIDALSYNKWLEVDFTLLARGAIVCGAYTTALLFLELAAESRSTDEDEGGNTSEEQILYEIYRHIDEPDGFYGINDSDLHQFLMKRFHHEKQWDKAFRFHGATLEAGGAQASDAEGLVNSFHSFGFDRLAIDALRSLSVTSDGASGSPGTSYRLGWRTETWDLPDRNENTPGVTLYLALRAIHRERDTHVIDSVIQDGLFKEMDRLRLLGPENLAEIREAVQNLMCLREITHWRREPTQTRLTSRQSEANWKEVVDIDPGFECVSMNQMVYVYPLLTHHQIL
jgi:ataxia telangiectasia mutated family protein